MKILHVIPVLAVGGAEIVLEQLLLHPQSAQHDNRVLCLGNVDEIGIRLAEHNIDVVYLGVEPKNPASLFRLYSIRKEIEEFRPDIIQTWMYHANLLTGWLTRFSNSPPIVWAIHQDISDKSWIKTTTMAIIKLGAQFSDSIPERVISVSERSVDSHIKIGYRQEKFIVIHNGFDIGADQAALGKKINLRKELGVEEESLIVGFFARFHEMKDHINFLAAAEIVIQEMKSVHFVLAGRQVDDDNSVLVKEIEARGLSSTVHLLGQRNDVPKLLAGLDLYTISSRSEGFPLSVGEAMAAGIPCVVTDVGDAAKLVGDTGLVVPPASSRDLAAAWMDLLSKTSIERQSMGKAARARIIEKFSLDKMVADYYQLYDDVVAD